MRTVRSLTVSRSICHARPPCNTCPPLPCIPHTTHAPCHAHPPPCMPPTMHTPPAIHGPPPHTPPTMHAFLPCMTPTMHAPLPHKSLHHACPPAMHAPPLPHTHTLPCMPHCGQNSWHTLLRILPCPKLRLRAVIIHNFADEVVLHVRYDTRRNFFFQYKLLCAKSSCLHFYQIFLR